MTAHTHRTGAYFKYDSVIAGRGRGGAKSGYRLANSNKENHQKSLKGRKKEEGND